MPVAETTAQWGKRLRKEQPENVFFIDPELIEPLQRAAAREGVTVAAWIKKSLKMRLHNQRGL
jgi:predicted HicB family RNase H-like nuclease